MKKAIQSGVGETPKREEQVLVLAAGGLTDKEIAVRLGISPDTVGTYWRRILAKYHASSRTEVVAKYAEDRSKAAVENLLYVNECLKLVADHMIENISHAASADSSMKRAASIVSVADRMMATVSDWILLLSENGTVEFSNKPVPPATKLSNLVTNENVVAILEAAAKMETDTELDVRQSFVGEFDQTYSFRFWPGVGGLARHIIGIGRSYQL